jgi:hypothetical protein
MAFGLGEFTDFLNKGERFPEIAKSKGPLDAVGIVTQLPIGSLCLEALGFITREWRDAAATRRACLLGERLGHILVLKLIIKATEGERSSIDLPEHDIERADDRRDIRKHVPAA